MRSHTGTSASGWLLDGGPTDQRRTDGPTELRAFGSGPCLAVYGRASISSPPRIPCGFAIEPEQDEQVG